MHKTDYNALFLRKCLPCDANSEGRQLMLGQKWSPVITRMQYDNMAARFLWLTPLIEFIPASAAPSSTVLNFGVLCYTFATPIETRNHRENGCTKYTNWRQLATVTSRRFLL